MASPFSNHLSKKKGKREKQEEENTADRLQAILPALQEIHDYLTISPAEILRLLRPFKENSRYRDYLKAFCLTESDYQDIAGELDALPDGSTVSLGSVKQMHTYSGTISAGARDIISRWLEKRPHTLTQDLDCVFYQELRYLLGTLSYFDLQTSMLTGIARAKEYIRGESFDETIPPIFNVFEIFLINYAMIPRRMAAPQSVRRAPLLEVQKALIDFCLLIYRCLTPDEKKASLNTMPWLASWDEKSAHYTWVETWAAENQISANPVNMRGGMPEKNKLHLATLDLHQLFLNTYHQRCAAIRHDPQDTISQVLLDCVELSRKPLLRLSESIFTSAYQPGQEGGKSFWEQAFSAIARFCQGKAGLDILRNNTALWAKIVNNAVENFMGKRKKKFSGPRPCPIPPVHARDLEALRAHLLFSIWNALLLHSTNQTASQAAWPALHTKLTAYANATINAQEHDQASFETAWLTYFISIVEPLANGPPNSPGKRKKEIEGMPSNKQLEHLETLLSQLTTFPIEDVHPLIRSISLTREEWERKNEPSTPPMPTSPNSRMLPLDGEEEEDA